jgi:hypothetical protein
MSEQHQNPIKQCPLTILTWYQHFIIKSGGIKFVIEYVDQLKGFLIRHVVTAS